MDKPHTYAKEKQAPQSTQTRKRQIVGDSDDDAEPRAKRARTTQLTSGLARLTRKNLALFDKMGKKNKALDSKDESKTTSTTTSGFDIKAHKNGILLFPSSKTPTNHKTRRERNARSRGTASPTETEHRGFVKRIQNAGNEATVVAEMGMLLKVYEDEDYTRAFNRAFTGFPKDVGFNNGLSAPQPDFVEGSRMQEYDPFPVDEYVSGAVLYEDDRCSVTLPQLAGEWEGPDGSIKEAELQSSYDGAALVYARNEALSYLGKSDPPGHAEVTTFTTDGTNLHFYSHYAAETEDKTLKYHQYLDASYNLMKFDEYKNGRRHLRNIQDDAKDQSYALRDQLKEHWKQQRSIVHPVAEEEPLPVPDGALGGASADEEAPPYEEVADEDYEVVEPQPSRSKHSQKRKTSSSHESSGHASKRRRLRSYWKQDRKTGQYYHVHSDGAVSWLDDRRGRRA